MSEEEILQIGICADGGLFVCPAHTDFSHIYRVAMEVSWDAENKRLFGPKPRDWTHARWFQQIVAAARDEYGVTLVLTAATAWTGVPPAVRAEISAAA